MSQEKQDLNAIVEGLLYHRAGQRQIPVSRLRYVKVGQVVGADFRIDKWGVLIDGRYAVTGDPIAMIDRVIDAIEEHARRNYEELARAITEQRAEILKRVEFLKRAMQPAQYTAFINSLHLPETDRPYPEWLAEVAIGEAFQDRGIHYRP